MTTNSVDDGALLAAWSAASDEAAFRQLCDRHAALVAAACRRQGSPDADEAAQAVFLILARRAGSVAGPGLAGWLHATARRVVARQRRAAARRRHHEREAGVEHARHQGPTAEPPWSEARPHLDEALASLSAGRREAILRFYLQGKAQAAVAAELGCSTDAAKTRVHEGLDRLRAFFVRRGVALGAAALATGLAAESAAAEPALAAACTRTVFNPASAPGAAALATGVATAMLIKTTALAAVATILVGSCLTAALLVSAEPPPAPASAPPVPAVAAPLDPSANAALDWWRAIYMLPKQDEEIWRLANDKNSLLPDPTADAMFGRWCSALNLLTLGASNPYCDWGIDVLHEGSGALIPYSSQMRSLVRLAILRTRWHAARGDQVEAVDDLLTVLRTARLFPGRKPLIIDFVIGVGCESLAVEAAGRIAPELDAVQRRRLLAALPGLPAGVEAAASLEVEIDLVRGEVGRLLSLPLMRRLHDAANTFGHDLKKAPMNPLAMTDANLRSFLEIYPIEIARWQAQLRRQPAERLRLEPTYTTGETAPHPLVDVFAPPVRVLNLSELRLRLLRQQLVAALDYLDRGDLALADHPNVLTGKPFGLEKTAWGFRLLADIPGAERGSTLEVGVNPAAHQPSDDQPMDSKPGVPSDF